jgi:hypothetical protein
MNRARGRSHSAILPVSPDVLHAALPVGPRVDISGVYHACLSADPLPSDLRASHCISCVLQRIARIYANSALHGAHRRSMPGRSPMSSGPEVRKRCPSGERSADMRPIRQTITNRNGILLRVKFEYGHAT